MFEPVRAMYAFRPKAAVGLIAASVAVASLFGATPFVLPEVAERYGVSLGAAGVISALQVGGFAASSFLAGRLLTPSRQVLVGSAAAALVANLASAAVSVYGLLLALRLVAGVAAGLMTWLAWADSIGDRDRMADVAATGPVTAVLLAPLLGFLASIGDDRALYLALAVTCVPALVLPAHPGLGAAAVVGPARRSRSNRVLLVALALMTMAGSSFFVFASAFGQSHLEMSALATSIGYSLNAAVGLVGTRTSPRSGSAGLWLLGPAAAVVIMVLVPNQFVWFATMAVWGGAFWLGVPEVFRLIASRTAAPDGQIGDAQAFMAVGRAIGPVVGGSVIAAHGYVTLGMLAGLGLTAAAGAVAVVEAYRRSRGRPAGFSANP